MALLQIIYSLFLSLLSKRFLFVLIGGVVAFLVTYLLTFAVIGWCRRAGWLDRPTVERRRLHKKAVPRLGGVAMFLSFVLVSLAVYATNFSQEVKGDELVRYWLLLAACILIVIVHTYDDIKGLKPLPKLLAQTVAVVIVLGPFAGQFHGTFFFGFSNPFFHRDNLPWFQESILTLFIHDTAITWLAVPAILLTWFWIVGMMNTVNLIDGSDGLATGIVGLTGLFITIISWTLHQYSLAILSAIFTGAVLGFLPHNWHPAKIFMGDSGSQFLGLGLAVLSIIGGAKAALALMVLGIPILDVAVVMIGRIRRGQSPVHFDLNHIHHRLLATGLTVQQLCYVFYGFTFLFGVLALFLSRIYKLLGLGLVGMTMIALFIWIDYRQRHGALPAVLDKPLPKSLEGQDGNADMDVTVGIPHPPSAGHL